MFKYELKMKIMRQSKFTDKKRQSNFVVVIICVFVSNQRNCVGKTYFFVMFFFFKLNQIKSFYANCLRSACMISSMNRLKSVKEYTMKKIILAEELIINEHFFKT